MLSERSDALRYLSRDCEIQIDGNPSQAYGEKIYFIELSIWLGIHVLFSLLPVRYRQSMAFSPSKSMNNAVFAA